MHVVRGRGRRATSVGIGLLLLFQLLSWAAPGSQVQAQNDEAPDLRGYATGQPAHVTALEAGGTRVLNTEVAWSGAAVDADEGGLDTPIRNEVNRIVVPDETADDPAADVAGQFSYGRGSGLEIGAVTGPDDPNQAILSALAEQVAPPDHTEPTVEEIAVEGAAPAAYASALKGEALARINESGLVPEVCIVGDDLSRGLGQAADVQLLDAAGDDADAELESPVIALDDQNPNRSVSHSVSRTKLVPTGKANNYGLMAEVRQTIAPVTLLQTELPEEPVPGEEEPARAVTIEFLGQWVLRVVATGAPGGASWHYGPGEAKESTPILKIIEDVADPNDDETTIIEFQDLFGEDGLPTNIEIPGLVELAIAESPRAIAKPGEAPDPTKPPVLAANGTSASAAVDVLRVRLLSQPDPQAADIRVGHMEVSATVPVGGVDCPIPVEKEGDRDTIRIGEEPDSATFTITVHNPYDCDMTETVLTDNISQEEGDPNFKVTAASPTPESPTIPTGVLTEASIVWNLGTIEPGGEKSVDVTIQSANAGGILRDIASATAKLANCSGQDVSGLGLAGLDISGLSVPVDVAIETPLTGATATRTAAMGGGLAFAAAAAGLMLRRRYNHQT